MAADLDLDAKREARGYKRRVIRLNGKDWELAPALPVLRIGSIVSSLDVDASDEIAMMKIMEALLPILEAAWTPEFVGLLDMEDFTHVMGLYGVKFTAGAAVRLDNCRTSMSAMPTPFLAISRAAWAFKACFSKLAIFSKYLFILSPYPNRCVVIDLT